MLTAELAKVAGRVVSIDFDSGLVPILSETLSNFDNVKIIEGDALKLNLKEIIEREFSGKKGFVCANIPYNISSKLVMKLLESDLNIEAVIVMVQKDLPIVSVQRWAAVKVCHNRRCICTELFGVSAGSFSRLPRWTARL